MKKYLSLMAVSLFLLASQPALAGSMKCGGTLIDDDRTSGQSRSEVVRKCGTPESSSGNNVYYKKHNVKYRLHFNDSQELESITEEIE